MCVCASAGKQSPKLATPPFSIQMSILLTSLKLTLPPTGSAVPKIRHASPISKEAEPLVMSESYRLAWRCGVG